MCTSPHTQSTTSHTTNTHYITLLHYVHYTHTYSHASRQLVGLPEPGMQVSGFLTLIHDTLFVCMEINGQVPAHTSLHSVETFVFQTTCFWVRPSARCAQLTGSACSSQMRTTSCFTREQWVNSGRCCLPRQRQHQAYGVAFFHVNRNSPAVKPCLRTSKYANHMLVSMVCYP